MALLAMPDHIHALVAPVDRSASPGIYSSWVKRWIRAELAAVWQWQPGCFDRLLRSDESAQEKWAYVRENPVAAGLVGDWEAWPYQIGFRDLK
jgi:putative transposase